MHSAVHTFGLVAVPAGIAWIVAEISGSIPVGLVVIVPVVALVIWFAIRQRKWKPNGLTMRCSEPGGGVVVAIVASRAPGRWALIVRRQWARHQKIEVNMIQLYDKESGKVLGAITDAQLQFLIAQLEEEGHADRDYYINRDTLELFERSGADTGLLMLLRAAIGEREEMEIRWSHESWCTRCGCVA
jgi:hypothetical protein